MKKCAKCGDEKGLEEFAPHKRRRGGIDNRCRGCRRLEGRERMKKWRAANPDRTKAQSAVDRKRLRERKPDYHRTRYWSDPENGRRKAREQMRESRAKDPAAERERKRRYRARHRELVAEREREKTYARRAKQSYSPALAVLMAELITRPCVYCGSTERISVDHVVPLSKGGKHEADNLAPACFSCNSSKSDRLLSEWSGRLSMPSLS